MFCNIARMGDRGGGYWYDRAVNAAEVMQRAVNLHRAGKLGDAEPLYLSIPQSSPDYADALHMLGVIASQKGKHLEAIPLLEKSALLRPTAETFANLGAVFVTAKKFDQAVIAYRNGIKLNATNASLHSALAHVLITAGDLESAIESCRIAIAIDDQLYSGHANLGAALLHGGQFPETIQSYRAASRCQGAKETTHSYLLFGLNQDPEATGETILAEHREWARRHSAKSIFSHDQNRRPVERLKVGYVSSDIRAHSVVRFLEPILACHDPKSVEVFVYAHVDEPDDVTLRLSRLSPHYRDIHTLSDEQAAVQIQLDKIDILVDLSGHTADNRLPIFAHKPAPIQVSYLGYPGTTGLSTIDYRLTDGYADPPGMTESHHSEKLIRLPDTFLCFRPHLQSPSVTALPAISSGSITFGSFNNFSKMNAAIVELWSKLLHRVPNSQLLIKARSLNDPATRQRLLNAFADQGIAAERIQLHPGQPKIADHLQVYGRVDIALDTYPYHGTTTTCEALWMGVPVVTLAGNRHISRVGVSILNNIGLPELIAKTSDEYVEIAAKLANDRQGLAEMRATIRQRMLASPLMDAVKMTRNIETAYQQMWNAYVAG
jgi:protein O-GlcNAc transferase